MKKLLYCFLGLVIVFSVGCSNNSYKKEANNVDFKEKELKKQGYSIEKSIGNGYIVNLHNDIKNYEKLEKFKENLNNKVKDEIKILSYTDEGDPVITDLIYDGKVIKYVYDTTLDEFGTPQIITKETKPEYFYSNNSGYFLKVNDEEILILPIYKSDSHLKLEENTFIGVISDINENLAIVDVKEGDILSSSDKVIVDLSKNKEIIFEVGTEVKVKHSGIIRESYPAQIDTIEIDMIY